MQATVINNTSAKKDKKLNNKDLGQVKYYVCHKKNHYTNKYSDKEPKNQYRYR